MQPPGPPRSFRGAHYDKDMFTFLPAHVNRDVFVGSSRKRKSTSPAHVDRDVLVESSRKRKSSSSDHNHAVRAPNDRHRVSGFSSPKLDAGDLRGKEIPNSARALRARESSNFKGYSEQSKNSYQNDYADRRPRSERGYHESRYGYPRYTSSGGRGRLKSPTRKVSSPLYEKDKYTFRPARFDRDVLAESSRKRKLTSSPAVPATNMRRGISGFSNPELNAGDLQGQAIESSQALRPRESSNFKGYSEKSQYWDQDDYAERRPRNEKGFNEMGSDYTGYTSSGGRLQSPSKRVSSPLYPISEGRTHKTSNMPVIVTEDFNQYDKHETSSHVTTLKGLDCPPFWTEEFDRCEERESNAHGGAHKRLDWQLPVVEGSYQHKIREVKAYPSQKSTNWSPSVTRDRFQHVNCESSTHVTPREMLDGPHPFSHDLSHHENNSNAHMARIKKNPDSQEFWSHAHQEPVQTSSILSDVHEHTSKSLGESQRLPQKFIKSGAAIGVLDEKGRDEEETCKMDSSVVKEYNDVGKYAAFDNAETYKVGSSSNVTISEIENFARFDSNRASENNVATSVYNLQTVTNNLLNVLSLLSAASGVSLAGNGDGSLQSNGLDVKMMKLPSVSAIQNLNNVPAETKVSQKHENGSNFDKPAANGERGSVKLDDECKFENGASAFLEKLWDGTLQLSTSISVSVIAFFKSGEKMQDFSWSESMEVKGKVRLEAFEKYVQELPRARSRGLMVMSLCCKEGLSDAGHLGMKEIARKYEEGKRVGVVELSADVDMYICPHSDAIITILAKNGFFKGMTAVKDQSEPLIGCVVWKKSASSAPAKQVTGEVSTSVKEKTPLGGVDNRRDKSPDFSPSPQVDQKQSAVVQINTNSVSSTEFKTPVEMNNPSSVAPKQSAEFSDDDDDDLPEFDFTAEISQASVQQCSEAHKHGIAIATQDKEQRGHLQGPALQILGLQTEVKVPKLPIQEQEQKSIEKDAASLKAKNLFDDDDMPEWCPLDFAKTREEAKRTESSFSLSNSNVPRSGFADLTSGYLLPPPPPPPPLTQMPFQGKNLPSAPHLPKPATTSFTLENSAAISSSMQCKRDYSSAPHLLPPPPPLTQTQVQKIDHMSGSHLPNPAASGCRPETLAAKSAQMSFAERDYSSVPKAPLPPVGNPAANNFMHQSPAATNFMHKRPAATNFMQQSAAANNFMHQSPAANNLIHQSPAANNFMHQRPATSSTPMQSPVVRSSQMQTNEKNYLSARCVPPPPVDISAGSNFMHRSRAPESTQMHFGEKNYSATPHPPTPFTDEPASDGLTHQNPAFPPGFAPTPSFRPCFDQPGMKNSLCPSFPGAKP